MISSSRSRSRRPALSSRTTAKPDRPARSLHDAGGLRKYQSASPGLAAALLAVVECLTGEFLSVSGDVAAALVEPLYRCNIREAARRVRVPVRGIGSALHPDTTEANRAYFRDYSYRALEGCGHYPMLEVPDAFDAALRDELAKLGS